MMGIFDWYGVLTPLFACSIALTLIAIKKSISHLHVPDIEALTKAKAEQTQKQVIQDADENTDRNLGHNHLSPFFKTLTFFLKNHTFLEICMTRSAKNKLPMFLAFSAIALSCYLQPSLYVYSLLGIPLVLVFALAQAYFEVDPVDPLSGQQQLFNLAAVKEAALQQDRMQFRDKILLVSYGTLSCGIGLFLCGVTYKNYLNSVLSALLLNLAVNFLLDIFVVRPVAFLLLSLPLQFHSKLQVHIDHHNLRSEFSQLSLSINVQNCAVNNMSPKKKKLNGSPTKVPKAFPRLENLNESENGLTAAMENLRKIKKEKRGFNELMTPLSRRKQICDDSEGLAVEEYPSNQNTPINKYKFQANEDNESGLKLATKRKDSELVIVEFKNNEQKSIQQQQQNKVSDNGSQKIQEIVEGEVERQEESPVKNNFIHSNLDLEDIPEYMAKQAAEVNVIKLVNVNGEGEFEDEAQRERRDSFMTLQNKNRLMSIEENGDDRQIQQIDLNSPERRRNNMKTIMQETSQEPHIKKKAKNFHSNGKKRVIKFTSGEPYLEYLPKMLSKEQNKHTKRSQPINYKNDLQNFVEKPRKSFNKIKTPKHQSFLFGGADENQVPQAIQIEDL